MLIRFVEEVFVSGTSLITYCKAANIPSESLSTFKYELYLPRLEFSNLNSFIITQWHGTPDPNFLRDKLGCVARTRDRDRFNVCNKYKCKKGTFVHHILKAYPGSNVLAFPKADRNNRFMNTL